MIGTTIGNYVVRNKIGEGGMGVVYLAEHPRIGRKVAIKVLLPEYSQNPEVVSRFFTEARASSAIKNEHIIDIIDFGELPDKSSYIIMEWLEGEALTSTLEREKQIPLERALHIARGMGRALAAAHRNGIVHRDLKPDNIFLVTKGEDREFAKVLDFGIAKLLGNEGAGAPAIASKTRTGAIIGTPMYMSPEQCRGVQVDERSDIYSFAVIVYQMLGGVVPFTAEGLGELLLKHMTEAPRPLRELVPTLPEPVERAVLRALEKDPDKRFRRVEDFVAELGGQATQVIAAARATAPLTSPQAPTAAHVSATDTIGAAAGETVAGVLPAPRRSYFAYAAVPIVVLGSIAVGIVTTRQKQAASDGEPRTPAAAQPRVAVEPATPLPSTVPSPGLPPTPAQGRLAVRATPPEAEILIDGHIVGNPHAAELPLDGRVYEVEIRAAGYASHRQKLTLDRQPDDVAVELAKLGADPRADERKSDAKPDPKKSRHGAVKLPGVPSGHDAPTADADAHPGKGDTKPTAHATTAPGKAEGDKPAGKTEGEKGPTIYKGTRGKLITDDPFAPNSK